jgi:hypothetical protein
MSLSPSLSIYIHTYTPYIHIKVVYILYYVFNCVCFGLVHIMHRMFFAYEVFNTSTIHLVSENDGEHKDA